MGNWGLKTFEFDGALDWYDHFCFSDQSVKELRRAFNTILLSKDYLDIDDCTAVLAAGEIIAAALGFPPDNFPDGAYHDDDDDLPQIQLEQLGFNIEGGLIQKAIKAIQRVKKDDDSELRGVFEDSNNYSEWIDEVDDLLNRINYIKMGVPTDLY